MSSSSSVPSSNALLAETSEPLLTQLGEPLLIEAQGIGSSSSSGPTGNLILDNIDLFRQYSLEQGLIESYFNDGVFFRTVDLDAETAGSSSSSSMLFSLTVNLERRSRPLESIPSDIVWYVYDEEVDGTPQPGLVSVSKTDDRTLVVSLASGPAPDGTTEFAFRINVEHPTLTASRTRYVFRQDSAYKTTSILSRPASGTRGRMSPAYVQYLLGWISDFWYAWDAGDMSLVPPLTNPFPGSFIPFYPFAHAWWKLRSELGALSALADPVPFSQGNTGLVENQNFLGVPASIWDCIGQGLYRFDDYNPDFFQGAQPPSFPRCPPGGPCAYKDPDVSFDCRSYAVLGAKFLQEQLTQMCPKATAKVMGVGSHYLVYVDLAGGGEPTPCCSGQFLYEPMDASVYKDIEDFCSDDPAFCENLEKPTTIYEPGRENSDNDFGDPNWEDDAGELARIESVICGCLNGNYDAGTNEANLKQVCAAGQMQAWAANNLSFTPERKDAQGNVTAPGSSPALDPQQTLECKFCVVTFSASYSCPTTEEGGGVSAGAWELSFLKDNKCLTEEEMGGLEFGKWISDPKSACTKSYNVKVMDTACGSSTDCGSASPEEPALPAGAPNGCCGAWCVVDSGGKKTGDCQQGSKDAHEFSKNAGAFNADATCEELDCCPPGYKKSSSGRPLVGTHTSLCVPDCTQPEGACVPGYCCSKSPFGDFSECLPCLECCESDPINYGYQVCVTCPDKTRSLRFDQ